MNIKDFTAGQLSRIYRLIEQLHKTNSQMASDRKVEGIAFYKDKRRNFMCSNVELSYTNGTFDSTYKCVMIEPDGTERDAIQYFGSDTECMNYLQKCEQIKIEK